MSTNKTSSAETLKAKTRKTKEACKDGVRLTARYHKKTYKAVVIDASDGHLYYVRLKAYERPHSVYKSISGAASSIAIVSPNGNRFWQPEAKVPKDWAAIVTAAREEVEVFVQDLKDKRPTRRHRRVLPQSTGAEPEVVQETGPAREPKAVWSGSCVTLDCKGEVVLGRVWCIAHVLGPVYSDGREDGAAMAEKHAPAIIVMAALAVGGIAALVVEGIAKMVLGW